MRIALEQIDRANQPTLFPPQGIDELELERLVENFSSGGCSAPLEWAKREAPGPLRQLMAGYLVRRSTASTVTLAHSESSAFSAEASANGLGKATTLEAAEREHISRASKSLAEAAARLGIDSTTLWRKRKLYHLE